MDCWVHRDEGLEGSGCISVSRPGIVASLGTQNSKGVGSASGKLAPLAGLRGDVFVERLAYLGIVLLLMVEDLTDTCQCVDLFGSFIWTQAQDAGEA